MNLQLDAGQPPQEGCDLRGQTRWQTLAAEDLPRQTVGGTIMTTGSGCSDSIIAELHALRERLAERFQGDLRAYSQAAEAHSRALGFDIIQLESNYDSNKYLSHLAPLAEAPNPDNSELTKR